MCSGPGAHQGARPRKKHQQFDPLGCAAARRLFMHKNPTSIVLATIGIVIGCWQGAGAQSRPPATARCPAGYWMLESKSLKEPLCLNNTSGDVVNAEPEVSSRIVLERGCAPGYWRLDSLCFDSATGDVEMVDEKLWPDGQRAEVRK